jgi:hypothetical protein
LSNTAAEYEAVINICKGTAWRILRIESITDQIFIKAQRIRTLEEKKVSKVDEDITGEYIGIVNYCVIAMMQLDCTPDTPTEMDAEHVEQLFNEKVNETRELMFAKNHDYGATCASAR